MAIRKRHNPERTAWRGRSHRRGGARVRALRDAVAVKATDELWYNRTMEDNLPATVRELSSKVLNERATVLAEVVRRSGWCLRDREARAYEAAVRGCAHAGDLDVLKEVVGRIEGAAQK